MKKSWEVYEELSSVSWQLASLSIFSVSNSWGRGECFPLHYNPSLGVPLRVMRHDIPLSGGHFAIIAKRYPIFSWKFVSSDWWLNCTTCENCTVILSLRCNHHLQPRKFAIPFEGEWCREDCHVHSILWLKSLRWPTAPREELARTAMTVNPLHASHTRPPNRVEFHPSPPRLATYIRVACAIQLLGYFLFFF